MIPQKNDEEIKIMSTGGKILSKIFEQLKNEIKPGVTTESLDKVARKLIKKFKAEPSFLEYRGYPAVLCCSINQEVVHGIPGQRKLKSGDIVGIDLGIKYKDFHVDRAETFAVGQLAPVHQRLIKISRQALRAGIAQAREGRFIRDISRAIQRVAEQAGFSVVRDCTGHGVGKEIHEEPTIPNYDTGVSGPKLRAGMTLAIEPMICERSHEVKTYNDNWTIVTADDGYSAHFEETVLITCGKPTILTK